jgi:S-adenosylmethionine/arginine decarboxylase-like enzyme
LSSTYAQSSSAANLINKFSIARSGDAEDDLIVQSYDEVTPWGMNVSIDIYGCDLAMIKDEKVVAQFIKKLVDFIGMKTYGDPLIKNFGPNPRLYGISAMQLIETSSITMHFSPNTLSAHIDIFSCRPFRPHAAGKFCKTFFKADELLVSQVTFRY